MVGRRRWLFWLIVVPLYCWCAIRLLFWQSPVLWDGSGPLSTFHWGRWGKMPPTPTAQEYHRSIAIRQELLYPYWVAASLITFAGCGLTTLLVRLAKPRRSRPFLAPAATTFVLLLVIAALSDVGIAFHLWAGQGSTLRLSGSYSSRLCCRCPFWQVYWLLFDAVLTRNQVSASPILPVYIKSMAARAGRLT